MAHYWQGKQVRLRAVEPSDASVYHEWAEDTECNRNVDRLSFPESLASFTAWAAAAATAKSASDDFHFVIENNERDLVGFIFVSNCNARNGTFLVGYAIRAKHRRKGYASDALQIVLRYYFHELRYQKAWATVYSFNKPSIALLEQARFVREGVMRRMYFSEGTYHDTIYFGITREEFEG